MNGRRAVIGLSLLCALVFCAFAAPSAMATQKGTTAATCVNKGEEFRGEHCLTTGTASKTWSHEAIAEGVETKIEATNQKTASETTASTSARLRGEVAGAALEIKAKVVSTTGPLTNRAGPPMRVEGTATIKYTELELPKNCELAGKAKEIIAEAIVETKTNEAGEMWVEFRGKKAKEVFAEFELVGEKCVFKNAGKIKAKGVVIGTPIGATMEFLEKEPKNTLELNEVKKPGSAEYIGIETVRMEKGGPIVLTTTAT